MPILKLSNQKYFKKLQSLLKLFYINQNKRIIFAGDFNIFFNSNLESKGGKPLPKRKSIAKLVHNKENLDICDVCRIRKFRSQNFTFTQSHSTRLRERWLDYISISNCLKEFVNYTDVLPALST